MCGICGIYDPRGGIDVDLVRRMNETLHHRGPDADAVKPFDHCVLAYKRLSIIDLPTGFQPMSDEAGRSWIVYNGEIYNYKALREGLLSRGHTLRTNSDTETIIHLYEEKGMDLLHDLNGMFAFAIWDEENQRLVLARDRLGIKPLYYRAVDGRLAFASEIKGILADPGVPRKLNYEALADYLTFQNVFGDKTFFEGIRILPAGHFLVARDGEVTVQKYWDLLFRDEITEEDEAVRRFGELLDESVEMQLMSDVPLGSHLSGGIDSGTVVVTATRKLAHRLKSFSVYFPEPEIDESSLIEQTSLHADTISYDLLLDPEEIADVLPGIMYHLDEPRVGPSVIPQWFIARLAAKEVKVVLTGHGGDELFAGYPSHLAAYLRDVCRQRNASEVLAVLRNLRARVRSDGWKRIIALPVYSLVNSDLARYGRVAIFTEHMKSRLLSDKVHTLVRKYSPRDELERVLGSCASSSWLNRALYLDVKTYLPSLLIVEDRISMAHSLEDRVPILDHRIAELSSRISARLKIRGLMLKNLPRKHAERLLPKNVLGARKVGFLVPIAEWFRGPLRPLVERTLLSNRALTRGFFRPRTVRRIVADHMSAKRDRSQELWSLLNIELWHRIWIDGETSWGLERAEDVNPRT
jgi:asparagine synthase (glutamine-hydrolysing)